MKTCLLLIGDGRDEYHERSVASAERYLPAFDHLVQVDDRDHSLGFSGAIAEGWRQVVETSADFVVHLEADFIFHRDIDVIRMVSVLKANPKIAQLALKRQPWNDEEKAAGGIVELHPEDYVQVSECGDVWTEHRRNWTTNPSVYSANWCRQGWPQEEHSEGVWTHRLLEDPELRFAFWGGKHDLPAVEHIGTVRAGVGY